MTTLSQRKAGLVVNADTVALGLFSALAGLVTVFVEVGIVGMTGGQWAMIRVIYNVLRFAGSRILRLITYGIHDWLPETSYTKVRIGIAGTIGLLVYQLPIYALSASIAGATLGQIAATSAMYVVDTVALGWVYGLTLRWVHGWKCFTRTD